MTEWAARTTGSEPGVLPPGLEPSAVVAGYELLKELGQGGMAVVWLARDTQLDRQVALKILAPGLAVNDQYRQRFITESRAASAIDDPHIIPVYSAGEVNSVLYIAMRYARGGDVGTLCRAQGSLTPARAVAIISPIASALDAAHEEGLVHRDVKPANMLLDTRPRRPDHIYLADFGLSLRSLSAQRLTMAGFVMGTPDYCSPEQINGKTVSGKADQYALACSTLELLTGTPPFPRDDSQAILYAHLIEAPPPLSDRRPGMPDAADRVLARGMAKNPDDRYPTCQDFADELREALGFPPYLLPDDADVPHADDHAPRPGRHRAGQPVPQASEAATVAMPLDSDLHEAPAQPGSADVSPHGGAPDAVQESPVIRATVLDPAPEGPPGPPGHLRAEAQADAVVLTWTAPDLSAGLTFKVIRLTTAPDGSQSDFRVLGITSSTESEDAGVPGGVLVTHEVVAIRDKLVSVPARTSPVLMMRDVANLRAQAGVSRVTLNWSLSIKFGKIVVEREAGPHAALTIAPRRAVVEGTSWTDASLAHGVEYVYHVFVEYRDARGMTVRTPGAKITAAALPPPRAGR
jgi:serine/threonine-protein kinase